MDIITQSYAFSKVSIHPLFVQVRKKKKFSSPTQHQQTNKQTRWWKKKKLQPIQPSFQKDTTTLIVHIYLYLLWHQEN